MGPVTKSSFSIVALLLVSMILFLFIRDHPSETSENAFALKNEKIDRILLYKKGFPTGGFLKAYDGSWHINESIKVDERMSALLLYVLKTLKIEKPVDLEIRDEVIEKLKNEGLILEYYEKKYLHESIYIAKAPNPGSSYAMIEGEDIPYVIHIPGSKNNLFELLSLPEINWKERTLFSNQVEDIEGLEIQYESLPEDSFKISIADGEVKVDGVETIDMTNIHEFLQKFRNVSAGDYISNNPVLLDSLKISKPFCKISIVDKDYNKNRTLILYSDHQNNYYLYGQIEGQENIIFIIPKENVRELLITKRKLLEKVG